MRVTAVRWQGSHQPVLGSVGLSEGEENLNMETGPSGALRSACADIM